MNVQRDFSYLGSAAKYIMLCLTIRVNNHDVDMQSLEGVMLPRTVAVRRLQQAQYSCVRIELNMNVPGIYNRVTFILTPRPWVNRLKIKETWWVTVVTFEWSTSFEFLTVFSMTSASFRCQLNRLHCSRDHGGSDSTLVCIQQPTRSHAVPLPTQRAADMPRKNRNE